MIVFLTVVFSMFVAGAEIDIAIPSFPEMRAFFGISPFMVELVLGINLLAHCIAALFCGNLGDKYGKKRVINYGFATFIAGSLLCALAPNFTILLLGRVLQGVGVAPAMVLSFIIAIEGQPKEKQEKIMGIFNGVTTLSICIAPVLGSYINLYFGWRGNFWLLFALGIAVLILFILFIPNDKKHEKSVRINIKEYFVLLKNKLVLLYVTVLCLMIASYYTFVGLAPIVYMEALGVSLKYFGFYQGALTLTFGIFSILSGGVIKLLGKKNSLIASIFCILAFIVINLILVFAGVKSALAVTLTSVLLSIGFVIPCNVMFVLVLEILPQAKGRVSALISTLKWVITIIGIQVASYYYNHSYFSLGITTTLMVSTALVVSIKLWRADERIRKNFNP